MRRVRSWVWLAGVSGGYVRKVRWVPTARTRAQLVDVPATSDIQTCWARVPAVI